MNDHKEFVILESENQKHYTLKERVSGGFNYGLYSSDSLNKVEEYAKQNNIEVEAIGSFYELVKR